MNWYYQKDSQRQGPYSAEEIDALIQQSTVSRSTLVWRDGMEAWAEAAQSDLLERFEVLMIPPEISLIPTAKTKPLPPAPSGASAGEGEVIQRLFTAMWICYAAGFVLTFAFGIGLIGILGGVVLHFILLHKFWESIQSCSPRTTPGKAVGFLLIPFFNAYWNFVAVHGLAKDLNRAAREKGLEIPEINEGMALAFCITILIPFVNLLTIALYFMLMKQFKDAAVMILAEAA